MATVTAKERYTGQFTADGTITVTGTGPCSIEASGTFGGGTITVQQDRNGTYAPVTNDGTDVAWTADNDTAINYAPNSVHTVRLSLASSTSPAIDVVIEFSGEPPLQDYDAA